MRLCNITNVSSRLIFGTVEYYLELNRHHIHIQKIWQNSLMAKTNKKINLSSEKSNKNEIPIVPCIHHLTSSSKTSTSETSRKF